MAATTKMSKTDHEIHPLLRQRWSPVAFSNRPIEPEKLRSLLEAARWAPSSFNEQPWAFLIATQNEPEELKRLLDCLEKGNIEWAKNCPVLMISIAKLKFDRNGKENRHAFHDVGLAAENLVLQAEALGLHVHQMAGILVDEIRRVYSIPETHAPVAGIAIGYHGDLSSLPEHLQSRETAERRRKPLKDFVYEGQFGKTAPIVK